MITTMSWMRRCQITGISLPAPLAHRVFKLALLLSAPIANKYCSARRYPDGGGAAQATDNPDLRDRAFIYWRLLSSDPEAARAMVLAPKPTISDRSAATAATAAPLPRSGIFLKQYFTSCW